MSTAISERRHYGSGGNVTLSTPVTRCFLSASRFNPPRSPAAPRPLKTLLATLTADRPLTFTQRLVRVCHGPRQGHVMFVPSEVFAEAHSRARIWCYSFFLYSTEPVSLLPGWARGARSTLAASTSRAPTAPVRVSLMTTPYSI